MTESIKLQFVREKDLSSQVIAWFSAGHVSHVDTVLDDGRLLGARSDRVGGEADIQRARLQNRIYEYAP